MSAISLNRPTSYRLLPLKVPGTMETNGLARASLFVLGTLVLVTVPIAIWRVREFLNRQRADRNPGQPENAVGKPRRNGLESS